MQGRNCRGCPGCFGKTVCSSFSMRSRSSARSVMRSQERQFEQVGRSVFLLQPTPPVESVVAATTDSTGGVGWSPIFKTDASAAARLRIMNYVWRRAVCGFDDVLSEQKRCSFRSRVFLQERARTFLSSWSEVVLNYFHSKDVCLAVLLLLSEIGISSFRTAKTRNNGNPAPPNHPLTDKESRPSLVNNHFHNIYRLAPLF